MKERNRPNRPCVCLWLVKNMEVVSMAKDIKKVHPEDVVCYKVGAFVQAFGKDAYVMSYLFGYKLSEKKENKLYICRYK